MDASAILGAGTGRCSGVFGNPAMKRSASTRIHSRVSWLPKQDCGCWPARQKRFPPSSQFDLVIMSHALEHCLDPLEAIGNAYLMTREGGYFYCEVPNCGCLHFETLTICSETFDSPRHLWFFNAAGLRRTIESQGYMFDSWRFNGFTRHHSASWRAWEVEIFDRLAKRGEVQAGKRHTFARSAAILARSAFAPAHKKYDCVGVLARKRPATHG